MNIADRLSELTLFDDNVPTRPGALTQFMDLDATTRKRVIVRVLCLLVAKTENEMKALPRTPASEAETRQWPLARARWPVSADASPKSDDRTVVERDAGLRR